MLESEAVIKDTRAQICECVQMHFSRHAHGDPLYTPMESNLKKIQFVKVFYYLDTLTIILTDQAMIDNANCFTPDMVHDCVTCSNNHQSIIMRLSTM